MLLIVRLHVYETHAAEERGRRREGEREGERDQERERGRRREQDLDMSALGLEKSQELMEP